MKLLLTSGGVTNASIRDALVELLGRPIAESTALCIPTAQYGHPMVGPGVKAWQFISGNSQNPMVDLGVSRDVELWIRGQDPTLPPRALFSEGEAVSCPLKHTDDVDQGVVVERIPRDCLEQPSWVRVGLDCLTFPADKRTMTLDAALTDGYSSAQGGFLGPPIDEP